MSELVPAKSAKAGTVGLNEFGLTRLCKRYALLSKRSE